MLNWKDVEFNQPRYPKSSAWATAILRTEYGFAAMHLNDPNKDPTYAHHPNAKQKEKALLNFERDIRSEEKSRTRWRKMRQISYWEPGANVATRTRRTLRATIFVHCRLEGIGNGVEPEP
ncbi:hypothetical protein RhiJN_24031 [Ceratobasidium sp. AG-Ba]|nr:hypothetical protein RhiJN_24031 [Ceratobasidium sp. AG-Ba]